MKQIFSLPLFVLALVASTQLIAKYWSPYLLFDDILLLLLTALCIFDLMINNSFSKANVAAALALLTFLTFSLVINFYSINAFSAKLFFYTKPLFVFVFIGYLSKKYFGQQLVRVLYKIFIIICLFAWFEFFYIQFIDFTAIEYFTFAYRSGFYRASSVTWHPISLALMGFVSILIGKELIRDSRKWPYVIFFGAIILSGTRFVILMCLVYFFYRYLFTRTFRFSSFSIQGKKLFLFSWPILLLSILLLSTYINVKDQTSLRSVAFRKGLPLLVNPKVAAVGTGVGSFGSYESVLYGSKVYDEIGFPTHFKEIMSDANKRTGAENFFFMALIELGAIGLFLYFCVLLRITSFKTTTPFFAFYVLIVLCFAFVYPLNALPYMYLINIFFPYGKIRFAEHSLMRKRKFVVRN